MAAVSRLMSSGKENHFSRLGLAVAPEIDSDALNQAYFARQRAFHPDMLAHLPAEERKHHIEEAMRLNEAYAILKHLVRRAEYLLSLHDIKVNTESGGVKPSPHVLIDAMEARERLQEAETIAALKALAAETETEQQQLFRQFAEAYHAGQLEQAAELAIRLRYAEKLGEEIKAKRRNHAVT